MLPDLLEWAIDEWKAIKRDGLTKENYSWPGGTGSYSPTCKASPFRSSSWFFPCLCFTISLPSGAIRANTSWLAIVLLGLTSGKCAYKEFDKLKYRKPSLFAYFLSVNLLIRTVAKLFKYACFLKSIKNFLYQYARLKKNETYLTQITMETCMEILTI